MALSRGVPEAPTVVLTSGMFLSRLKTWLSAVLVLVGKSSLSLSVRARRLLFVECEVLGTSLLLNWSFRR